MPFVLIFHDFDVIFNFRVILNKNQQNTCFRAKVTFKKKKAPARMLVTVVRSGEAPPDGRFFKIRELAISKLF